MKERIVIIFIAVTLGLLATTVAFFLYESAKPTTKMGENKEPITKVVKTQNPTNSLSLNVTDPKDQSLTSKRTITVKGSTNPENTLLVSTNQEDVAALPTKNGDFSVSIAIDAGVNELMVTAIAPDGSSKKDLRVISYSSDEF